MWLCTMVTYIYNDTCRHNPKKQTRNPCLVDPPVQQKIERIKSKRDIYVIYKK